MSISIAGAATALNAQQITHRAEIDSKLRQVLEMENYLSPVTARDTYSAPNVATTEVLQPYQKEFTPKGDATFNGEVYTLDKLKIDIEFEADHLDQFFDTWKAEWDQLGERERAAYTFPRWLYNTHIIPQLEEDIELKLVYNGVKAAPTPGTPGDAEDGTDGLAKRIADAITASKIAPITTGALTAANILEKTEEFCDAIPQPYRDVAGDLLMSKTNARRYWRAYREAFGTGNSNMGNENNELRVDGTNKRILGFACMEGSNRIIFNPSNRRNLIKGYRRGGVIMPQIRWQEFERTLKGLAEFHRFYGFNFAGHLFVNDQA